MQWPAGKTATRPESEAAFKNSRKTDIIIWVTFCQDQDQDQYQNLSCSFKRFNTTRLHTPSTASTAMKMDQKQSL